MSGKILVIGDQMFDVMIRAQPKRVSNEERFGHAKTMIYDQTMAQYRMGGAAAVAQMIKAFGFEVVESYGPAICTKKTIILDEQVLRIDIDQYIEPDDDWINRWKRMWRNECFSAVVVSDYGKGTINARTWELITTHFRQVIVDPCADPAKHSYTGAWGYVPNQYEVDAEPDCSREFWGAVEELPYPNICLKLGGEGMFVRSQEYGDGFVHGNKVEVLDSCGCGDQVLAAIACMTAAGASWRCACEFANWAGAKQAEVAGATPLMDLKLPERWRTRDVDTPACDDAAL